MNELLEWTFIELSLSGWISVRVCSPFFPAHKSNYFRYDRRIRRSFDIFFISLYPVVWFLYGQQVIRLSVVNLARSYGSSANH